MMTRDQWTELIQLAERYCPSLVNDLSGLTEADALGILCWLRRKSANSDSQS